jgi:hypothetical protein
MSALFPARPAPTSAPITFRLSSISTSRRDNRARTLHLSGRGVAHIRDDDRRVRDAMQWRSIMRAMNFFIMKTFDRARRKKFFFRMRGAIATRRSWSFISIDAGFSARPCSGLHSGMRALRLARDRILPFIYKAEMRSPLS